MKDIKPFPYQDEIILSLISEFKIYQRLCVQLGTSGGKTVIFAFFIKWYLSWSKQNVLILCHREELVNQAEEALSDIDIGSELVFSNKRKLKHHSNVYISMIETANNRLKNNPHYFPNVGLVITDECHWLIFDKVFDYFGRAKILGCSATPIVIKRETFWKCRLCRTDHVSPGLCCDEEVEEWTRPMSLSKIYENVIVGPQPSFLIEFGSIVQEISFIKHYTDDSKLRTDTDGEFIAETVEAEYGTDNAAFNVILNYEELCAGKKTLVFNSSAKANLLIYEKFISAGYANVRMYDSVNKTESGSRKELLQWFADTPDAILLNCGVFTTGFNSREVEAIIINRPIGSLSLYLQITGRGCRSSIKIYKDSYILVDGGGNIDRFGEPSIDRDWRSLFFDGNGKPRAKKINAIDIHDCPECGALYPKSANECPECGHIIPVITPSQRVAPDSNEVMKPIRPIPPPNGERIYQYCLSREEDINFGFKIMIAQLVDMYRMYRISHESYETALQSGELDKKTMDMIRRVYFVLLRKPDIQTKGNRTLQTLLERTKKELKKYYETRGKFNSAVGSSQVQKSLLSKAS